jgi:flagellar hook protein FlgE
MTLNSTFSIGVSGLLSQSTKISSISDNIANVNTVGYKGFTTDFLALVQDSSAQVSDYYYGARSSTRQNNTIQGEISGSDRGTDIAINGNGFFIVTPNSVSGSDLMYTRAGTFSPDKDGNLRNSAGFYLQGWPLDSMGNLPGALQGTGYDIGTATSNLELVNIATTDSTSVPTGNMAVRANLDADQTLYNPEGQIVFAANPTAGDTITINGVTWTFVASGATGNQTNIGSNLDITVRNLVDNLNASTNAAITPATYSTTLGNNLKVVYDSMNGSAATFTLASSSANGTPTQLLLYDPAVTANNMTSGAIPSHFNRSADIIDNNGVKHTVNINFLKTAVNTWAVELSAIPATDITTAGGMIASGLLTFNGDGTLASISSSLSDPITFPWTSTGTTPANSTTATTNNTVTFNWGTAGQIFGTPGATVIGRADGMRQLAANYIVDSLNQDGHAAGSLQRVEITDDGIVKAFYNNGVSQSIYVIPLAKFNNPDGLNNISGTAYLNSDDAGIINYFVSGLGGVGDILSSSLENSNVELSSQLTDIIIAQRAYQSNTKTVTTADDMLQTVTEMLR